MRNDHDLHGRPQARGFTLIELLLVMGIIAVLVGIAIPLIGVTKQYALKTKNLSLLRKVHAGLLDYKATYGNYPLTHINVLTDNSLGKWLATDESAVSQVDGTSAVLTGHVPERLIEGEAINDYYGNPLVFLSTQPPDDSTTVQAESMTLNGPTVESSAVDYHGSGYVQCTADGDSVEFSYDAKADAAFKVTIRVGIWHWKGADFEVTVDGSVHASGHLKETGRPDELGSWGTRTFTVDMSKGTHTVGVIATTGSRGYHGELVKIDEVIVERSNRTTVPFPSNGIAGSDPTSQVRFSYEGYEEAFELFSPGPDGVVNKIRNHEQNEDNQSVTAPYGELGEY